jgi:hypothetical protein
MQKFKFAKGKSKKIITPARTIRAKVIRDPKDEPPFFIRGIQAGSKEEWWVSLALDQIAETTFWGWAYQVPVYGGRNTAGGNVVDFLVYTPGRWTMLEPMGKYWHTGRHEDRYQMENVARTKNWILIAWFTDETPTKEIMLTFLRDKLNV